MERGTKVTLPDGRTGVVVGSNAGKAVVVPDDKGLPVNVPLADLEAV